MAVLKSMVNEDRLLSLVHNFFARPEAVLIEIAQNSQRSGASKLDIIVDGGSMLRVKDNGAGIIDPTPLFVLADSDWSEDVEKDQMPAGWGLFYLYSISKKVTLRSKFGTITFDSERFFTDVEYRKNVLNLIDRDAACEGFEIDVCLKRDINAKLQCGDKLGWFPMDITFNGIPVPKKSLDNYMGDKQRLETEYEGNRVVIDPFDKEVADVKSLLTIWYGIPVEGEYCRNALRYLPRVIIDAKQGCPLTPVLPYRESIKEDKKLQDFMGFVRETVVEFLIPLISEGKDRNLLQALKVMEHIATQEELDRLDKFYVVRHQPYHQSYIGYSGVPGSHEEIIVDKADSVGLVNESLLLKGLDSYKIGSDYILLPDGVITAIKLPARYPSWLSSKISNKDVEIRISIKGDSYPGAHFGWQEADIKGAEMLFIKEAFEGSMLFYDKPVDIFNGDLSELIFTNVVFSEEGDCYDTQFHEYEESIREDIMQITGKYDVLTIFKGLWTVGIAPWSVLSIRIDKDKGNMIVKTVEEEKTFRI